MVRSTLHELTDSMPPVEALRLLADEIKRLFTYLGEEDRTDFLVRILGEASRDDEAGLAHF